MYWVKMEIIDLRLKARGIQHTAVRRAHRKHEPTFHDKYGTVVLLGGAAMFSAVWGYTTM
ncbi:hypothetical protein IHE44_0003059 [Lamprotornis superbus]|uniref:Cytochrome c oxidase subunit 7B, mitochondrial n=1 Tax=Lamprotornis superbus TaxID=245042 RepID=A0A835TWD6_9PASS|nr:hypothetical protein IHE44_0003059 [Lamprotornis superbus]